MFRAPPLPRTFDAALRDLNAERPADRASAVRDLVPHAEQARDQVLRALQKALRSDKAAEVRSAAATALADLDATEALSELLLAVEDEDPFVRQMAIAALGELGDSRATERLRRALSDDRAEVRFQAVMAYARVVASREDALLALLAATRDRDALVVHIALRMTEELAEGDGAKGRPDPRVIERARALLGHASSGVRVIAALLVADGDDARVRSILIKAADGEEPKAHREDLAAAIELAGALGLEAARAGLERRAFGGLLSFRRDPLAWHARVALARMGHERARREILRELGDRGRDGRTLAVAAAGRAQLEAARDPIAAMKGDPTRADPNAVEEALAALAVKEPSAMIPVQPCQP